MIGRMCLFFLIWTAGHCRIIPVGEPYYCRGLHAATLRYMNGGITYEGHPLVAVCTQVPKHVILTDLPRYAATAFTVISFCTCSGGLNMLQSGSLISSSTAMRGKIPCLWQVRATEISTEKTSLPSGSESW